MTDLPKRKPNRLKDYDYGQNGAYFVTICTKNHECLFGTVGATVPGRPPVSSNIPYRSFVSLTELGKFVDKSIIYTHNNGDLNVKIEKYVIMPNHVHLIIGLYSETGDRPRSPLQMVVRNIKSYVSKWAGFTVWQKSFYDHIIRDDEDYNRVAEYIENNPEKWIEDRYYLRQANELIQHHRKYR